MTFTVEKYPNSLGLIHFNTKKLVVNCKINTTNCLNKYKKEPFIIFVLILTSNY